MYYVITVTEFPDRESASRYAKAQIELPANEVAPGGKVAAAAAVNPSATDAFSRLAAEVIDNVIGKAAE